MIIVDTMVISEAMLPTPFARVIHWLDSVPRAELYATAILQQNCVPVRRTYLGGGANRP